MDTFYSTHFADYRRSSFQNIAVKCGGKILWSKSLPPEVIPPQAIYVFNGRIVVVSQKGFSLFSSEGTHEFHQNIKAGSPIGLTDSLVYYQDEHYRLSAVNIAGEQIIKNSYFPGPINSNYPIALLWTGRKDYVSIIQFTGGAEELPRKVMVDRTTYGNRLSQWTFEVDGSQILPPLYIREMEQIVVFAGNIYFVDAVTGREISRQEYPLDEPILASAGAEGTVYISGASAEGPAIAAIAAGDKRLWKWIAPDDGIRFSGEQPPMIGQEGLVCVLYDSKVTAIINGKQVWSGGIEGAQFSRGTIFAGGTVVLAAGKRLVGLDHDGKKIFDIEFDDVITAPPVAADDGTLYLLIGNKLLRVR